jgi:hypothetical protein
MMTYHEYHVCAGCLCEIANGESDLTDAEREIHYANVELAHAEHLTLVPGDDEYGFEHGRCGLCNGLAGDRYSVVAIGAPQCHVCRSPFLWSSDEGTYVALCECSDADRS